MMLSNVSNTSNAKRGMKMSQVSTVSAGRIINRNAQTIRRHVNSGILKAEREFPSNDIWIEIDELRRFAKEFNYRFNEELASQLARN
jgi:hypothetical protein